MFLYSSEHGCGGWHRRGLFAGYSCDHSHHCALVHQEEEASHPQGQIQGQGPRHQHEQHLGQYSNVRTPFYKDS